MFSLASGLVLVGGAAVLVSHIGVPVWALASIGGAVVGFGALLLWLLTEPTRLAVAGRVAVAADLAWIAATAAVTTAQPTMFTATGSVALGVLTAVVAAFAAVQALGLRRVRGASATGMTALAIRADRLLAASPAAVWDAVSDASGYARVAAGIAATEIVSGAGEGMVRVCTDDRGAQWSETCTLWEPGRRYRMRVDVATYPPQYRALIDELTQTWSVHPAPGGTLLTLTFDARVKLGIVGRAAARVLGRPARLDEILAAYQRELTAPHPTPADAATP